MKIYKFFALFALSFLLASCSDVWTGDGLSSGKADFSDAEEIATGNTGSTKYEIAKFATFELNNTEFFKGSDATLLYTFDKASENTQLSLKIKTYARLDKDSVKNAFSFFELQDNSDLATAFPTRKSKLTSSVVDITETVSSGNADSKNVETTVDLIVNTQSVSKNAIALLIDATVLKDVYKKAVINANRNEVCGEESDSLVRYIGITYKSDDTTTDALSFTMGEDFAPELVFKSALNVTEESDSDGKITFVSGSAEFYNYKENKSVENKELSSALNKLYSVQILAPGNSEWTKSAALNFSYNSSEKRYKSTELSFEIGSRYRIVKNVPSMNESVQETEQSTILYGHKAYQNYTASYVSYEDEKTMSFYKTEPDYIVSIVNFAKGIYNRDAIIAAQNALLTVTKESDTKFEVDLGSLNGKELKFNSYNDFILTDENLNLLESTVYLKDYNTVVVSLKNEFYKGDDIQLWVGNGVSIKENPLTDSSATKFGLYKAYSYGVASGYVKLN